MGFRTVFTLGMKTTAKVIISLQAYHCPIIVNWILLSLDVIFYFSFFERISSYFSISLI